MVEDNSGYHDVRFKKCSLVDLNLCPLKRSLMMTTTTMTMTVMILHSHYFFIIFFLSKSFARTFYWIFNTEI